MIIMPNIEEIAKQPKLNCVGLGASYNGILNIEMYLFKKRVQDAQCELFHLSSYDPEWETIANNNMMMIREKFKNCAWFKDIQHIGSTSIPGMSAKPAIELMLGYDAYYPNLNEETIDAAFAGTGFERKDSSIYFYKNDQSICVSVVPYGFKRWESRILFRDYLINNPEEQTRYLDIKKSLIKSGISAFEYTTAKGRYYVDVFTRFGWSVEDMIEGCVIRKDPNKVGVPMRMGGVPLVKLNS